MPTNFSLSLELVLLMNWLLKHEKRKVKNLVENALERGFYDELDNIEQYEQEDLDNITELHMAILDFLLFMEDSLLECLEKKDMKNGSQEKLKPTLQKINKQNIDLQTVWLSAQQAQTKIRRKSRKEKDKKQNKEEMKNILFSQLIKNWKPKNNDPLN